MQEQGRADTFLGVGPRFKDYSFEATVEEAIQHWTRMWMADSEHDAVISSNVKVGRDLWFRCRINPPKLSIRASMFEFGT
jgi:hypothetical protein